MVTTERPAYYVADRFASYCGLSNDDKTTIDAKNADEFYEIDTGKTYRYDAVSKTWIEQPASRSSGGSGGGDFSIPAYTTADNGKVLGVVEGKLAWVSKS